MLAFGDVAPSGRHSRFLRLPFYEACCTTTRQWWGEVCCAGRAEVANTSSVLPILTVPHPPTRPTQASPRTQLGQTYPDTLPVACCEVVVFPGATRRRLGAGGVYGMVAGWLPNSLKGLKQRFHQCWTSSDTPFLSTPPHSTFSFLQLGEPTLPAFSLFSIQSLWIPSFSTPLDKYNITIRFSKIL